MKLRINTFKDITIKESAAKGQFSRRVLQKDNFHGSFCNRGTFMNDPDNCSFKEGSKTH
jgi:hypothetical protein